MDYLYGEHLGTIHKKHNKNKLNIFDSIKASW
jgi:hypothetical protein